jgi:folate-binding protein YgfZ
VHEAIGDPTGEAAALDEGRAFVDLSDRRKVRVTGADARAWLGDLVTSDVVSLEPGRSQRSLLLGPTGGIRADVTIGMDEEGFLLVQAPDQPARVDELLAPYVLSSDVRLTEVTDDLAWFAVPGGIAGVEGRALAPSVLGSGVDLVAARGDAAERLRDRLRERGLAEAGAEAAEVLRVRRGAPRLGVDFEADALPLEAALEDAVDFTKGCFLGQESVARVRNLGHARTVLRHVRSREGLAVGAEVRAAGAAAGFVTSAARSPDGGGVAIVRLRWEAAEGPWTADGAPLDPLGQPD